MPLIPGEIPGMLVIPGGDPGSASDPGVLVPRGMGDPEGCW